MNDLEIDDDLTKLRSAGEARVNAAVRAIEAGDGAAIARELIEVYGYVDEVAFLSPAPSSRSLIVFQAGAAVLVGSGTYVSILTFGYSGQGPSAFAAFLEEAGFLEPATQEIKAPMRLFKDGSRIGGTVAGTQVQWEDGAVTNMGRQ